MMRAIQWAIRSPQSMNILMLVTMLLGIYSFANMRRETFPEFDLEFILVSVPYPGASPDEVEEGICQKIEESVRAIAGIKKKISVAQEGFGFLVLELEASVKDVQRVVNEVRSEVNRISSFPRLAEQRDVRQITMRQPAIRVGVMGPDRDDLDSQLKLREVTEQVRLELLSLTGIRPSGLVGALQQVGFDPKKSVISQANIIGELPYQIDVEISEETLRKYGLTLKKVAQILRDENVDVPGGTLKSNVREVLLRGKNRRVTGEEIGKLPLLSRTDGVVLTVDDLGDVTDGFVDVDSIDYVNGRPAQVIAIDRTANEDVLALCDAVHKYVDDKTAGVGFPALPAGYRLETWFDQAVPVRDRMELLQRNGLQGLLLVFCVLAVFLELRLAYWVALGIPISVLGAGVVLLYFGQTLNLLSLFAFLLALGIVVDDAIVIGENIYRHRLKPGGTFAKAAVEGTYEVMPAVVASVTTTIIAFAPLFFVAGVMGKFFAVLPMAVIAMLAISLLESLFILPCHLSHKDGSFFRALKFLLYPVRFLGTLVARLNRWTHAGLDGFITRIYLPSMRVAMKRPYHVVAAGVALLVFSLGLIRSGRTPFILFPKVDSYLIAAKVTYPEGTPVEIADEATRRLDAAAVRAARKLSPDGPLIKLRHRAVGHSTGIDNQGTDQRSSGPHVGVVDVELVGNEIRSVTSDQLIAAWRQEAGAFPGSEALSFGVPSMGPGGKPIEFKLVAPPGFFHELEAAREFCKQQVGMQPGVYDVGDDLYRGKLEYQFTVKDRARAMGITAQQLAETIRGAYFGEEVMRLQRGRHEVKLMVRYPGRERRSLSELNQVRVRGNDQIERPISEVADIREDTKYAEINRLDQMRCVTITADVDDSQGNAAVTVAALQQSMVPAMLEQFPHVRVRWEGQAEQSTESVRSLAIGFCVAVLGIFVVLTLVFRSYFQPFLILAIIPFGLIGAVWGHALMGLALTLFSLCGVVALTGVVINDSIVLVDYVNRSIKSGMDIEQALMEAGRHRFRPVLLTSLTTVAGLFPLLLETSFQAQLLKPMANAITFGLMAGTFLILYLVPTFYMIYARWTGMVDSSIEPDMEGLVQTTEVQS